MGMVVEMADGGDLTDLYKQKKGQDYSFKIGLKIVLGAAKGLAHMHSMPTPIVHRDVKSGNILVMADGVTGKLGDCGVSRRVDLESNMTIIGSPLWAAPELLAGKRYCEDVDTFSLGAVLYEVAVRELPYESDFAKYKKQHGNNGKNKIMREIAAGQRRPELAGKARKCRRYGVGGAFRKRESAVAGCEFGRVLGFGRGKQFTRD